MSERQVEWEVGCIDGEWVLLEPYIPEPPRVPQSRRVKGSGCFYKRAQDGLWTGRVEYPRQRGEKRKKATVCSLTFCGMLKKFTALEKPPGFDVTRAKVGEPYSSRRWLNLQQARQLGTHTADEWYGQMCAQAFRCYYCRRQCGLDELTKDHMTPITCGGSDAIDNIVGACMGCNWRKGTKTAEQFMAGFR